MARRSYWAQVQREQERERARQERQYRAMLRDEERTAREAERERAREDKEHKRLYLESRATEVDAKNRDLDERAESLRSVLSASLTVDDHIDFEALKERPNIPRFAPGRIAAPRRAPALEPPPAPTGLRALVPGAKRKHAEAAAAAEAEHEDALAIHHRAERERQEALEQARAEHQRAVERLHAEAAARDQRVDEFCAAFEAGEPEAVVDYFGLVLTASRYPDGFPKSHKLAFVPESKQLVLEYDFPRDDVVPAARQYRYVKSKDEISELARPQKERRGLYTELISQTALRCVHELFEADRHGLIETIVFNGYVAGIDGRTGQPARPCLLTLRTTRERFLELDLAHVEAQACLRGLGAGVSRSPAELTPVRPVLDFNMVDSRFVEEDQVLATLDQRPNLMELTPSEFESLITNLFERMGLETRMTQASRDGGVDCVAFDTRPILGGKIVIQAKRYKSTVGVSAVRDLFGTVQNEGEKGHPRDHERIRQGVLRLCRGQAPRSDAGRESTAFIFRRLH